MSLPARKGRGFTLLELLVAVALFALVAAMAYAGLSALISQDAGLRERSESLRQVQLAAGLLQWDLTQIVDRSVRDPLGGVLGPVVVSGGTGSIEFTRAGMALMPGVNASALARIRYRVQGGALIRERLLQLDASDSRQVIGNTILDDVTALRFEFRDAVGARYTSWPPAGTGDNAEVLLPKAIEVIIEHERWGELRRMILVQG